MFKRRMMMTCIGGAMAIVAAATAHAAVVTVGNTSATGVIAGVDGNESSSISFDNNTDFLAVIVTAASNGNMATNIADPTVTFNGVALTAAKSSQFGGDGYVGVFYLANPLTGSATLLVDFGASIFAVNDGNWSFGALSLSNVDLANPVASTAALPNGPSLPYTYTMTSNAPGDLSAGDLLLMGTAAQNSFTMPNYQTPTNSAVTFYAQTSLPESGNRQYAAATASLVSGDLSGTGGDELILTQQSRRSGTRTAVVFNAIPEPASMSLMALGLVMIARRRRA